MTKSTEMTTDMQDLIQMAKGLQQSAAQAADDTAGYLKFTKYGAWIFGTEDTELEEDSLWAIHPQGFKHGYIAWGDAAHGNQGEKLGEVLVPATQQLPRLDSLDEIAGEWRQQVSMQFMCLSGFDEGVRLVFNSNSVGGRKAYQKVVSAVIGKISAGELGVVPVVTLGKDSYSHKKFGVIFTPEILIQEFKTLKQLDELAVPKGLEDQSGSPEDEEEVYAKAKAEAEAKAEEEPVRKRRTRRSR